jgi:hypothetical protein
MTSTAGTKSSTREGRAAVRWVVNLGWDGGDLQGSALGPLFGVCETLHAFGELVPDECEFRASPLINSPDDLDEWPAAELAQLVNDGDVAADDLRYWARVLNRFVGLIPDEHRY